MNNSKGSTLAIALSMVILFAGLGVGAINFGGAQRWYWTNQIANAQAFWLADAGVVNAIIQLPPATVCVINNGGSQINSLTSSSVPLGKGTYSVNVFCVDQFTDHWKINSTGVVNNHPRFIQAFAQVLNFSNIVNAIDVSGSVGNHVDGKTVHGGSPSIVSNDTTLSTQRDFGLTLNQLESLATMVYPSTWLGSSVSGRPLFSTTTTSTVTLTISTAATQSAFLIIDAPNATAINISTPNNLSFNGILWVNTGSQTWVTIGRGSLVTGAIIVQGNLDFLDNGNNRVTNYNSSDFPSSGNPFISSWKECANSNCT